MADNRSIVTRLPERTSDRQGVEGIIRWLLAELSAIGVTAIPRQDLFADNGRQEVVLDVEVDGERWRLTRHVVEAIQEASPALSPREHEIARMVARGYANKSIASVLDISSWTVSSHLRRIYAKLGVSSRAAMVARLLEDNPGSGQPLHRHLSSTPLRRPTAAVHGPTQDNGRRDA
jgi:DNA-binding CsgD family transcriptional regulator